MHSRSTAKSNAKLFRYASKTPSIVLPIPVAKMQDIKNPIMHTTVAVFLRSMRNFSDITSRVFPGLVNQFFPEQMHDMFVQSFLDTGFLGLISLVSLVVLHIWSGIKAVKKEHSDELLGMFLILIAIAVYCCFDLGIWFRKWFYSGIFWLFSGYFWWLCRYEKRAGSGK